MLPLWKRIQILGYSHKNDSRSHPRWTIVKLDGSTDSSVQGRRVETKFLIFFSRNGRVAAHGAGQNLAQIIIFRRVSLVKADWSTLKG